MAGGSAARTASVRLGAPRSRAAATVGTAARMPMVAAEPAYTPASIGSTARATTWLPNRSPTISATDGSPPRSQRSGRAGSAAIRSNTSSSTRPRIEAAELGMPLTVSAGSECSRAPQYSSGRTPVVPN